MVAGSVVALLGFVQEGKASLITAGPFDRTTMSFSYLQPSGLIGFDGTSFYTPGGAQAPTDTFRVNLSSSTLAPSSIEQDYPNATFKITSGFQPTGGTIFDDNTSGLVDAGDGIRVLIGAGAFDFLDSIGRVIVHGSFSSAVFNSALGQSSGTLLSIDSRNLDLTAGPGFVFDNGFATDIADPEGFTIGLPTVSGITTNNFGSAYPVGNDITSGVLQAFNPQTATGSATLSGTVTVTLVTPVPEPSVLTGCFAVGLLMMRRRRSAE